MVKKYKRDKNDEVVLVCVLKDRRDLDILLTKRWYRIPVAHAPTRKFKYLAFYQPAGFAREGKRILYYAPVLNRRLALRKNLFPEESDHPRAGEYYLRFRVGEVHKLSRPVLNLAPRRISFGFTTLNRLLKSKNILQLYRVAPTEQILENALKRADILARPQYIVRDGQKRFRIDFAIFCRLGSIVIECDNKKAHSGRRQRTKDKIKNTALKHCGWTVIRLAEEDIISDLEGCMQRIQDAVRKLGGLKSALAFQ